MLAWCAAEGLYPDATRVIRDVIRVADHEYLEKQAAKRRLQNVTGRQ